MNKILIIDDTKENLEAVKDLLEELIPDCVVIATQYGKEGLILARDVQPDVIISDVFMPEMDGIEVCKRLKEDEATKHIPIIIHSGSKTDAESRIQCLEAGADVFLAKPIDAGELTAQINAMLRIKKAEDKLRAEKEQLEDAVQQRTKELKESEENYRSIYENMHIGIYRTTPEGEILIANPALIEILKFNSFEELNTRNLEQNGFYRKNHREEFIEEINRDKQIRGFESTWLRHDGKKVYVRENAKAFYDTEGNIKYYEGTIEDITERKQAEEALAEIEQLNRTVIENSPIGISVRDKNGTLLLSNKAWKTLWGSSEKDISADYQKRKKLIFNEKDSYLHDHLDEIRKVYSEGGQYFIQDIKLSRSKKNKAEWISQHFYSIKNENGEVEKVVILTEDITERKQSEKIQKTLYNISNALNTTDKMRDFYSKIREYLRNVIDTTNFYVALYDEKTDMISLPFDVDEKDVYDTFPAGKTITKYVIKTGKSLFATKDVEKKLIKKGLIETVGSPSEIWLGVPLKIENKVIGVIAVQSYDDPNLYTEKDIEILNFISEEIALAINRKQAEEELKINRERLKTANSILRHDIANDLIVIKSALDIYHEEQDKAMLDEIEKRVEKSLNTIKKQRDQEQFIDSHADLDEYEIEKVAHDIIKNISNIKFNVTGSGKAYADNAIYSVFENIISNAIKHGKTTKMDIDIHSDENHCEIRLADHGIGIPDDIKHKVFDKGFQYGENGHTGIGLYIVQKTIDDYGGLVYVEDNKPHGAVIVIRLRKTIERKNI